MPETQTTLNKAALTSILTPYFAKEAECQKQVSWFPPGNEYGKTMKQIITLTQNLKNHLDKCPSQGDLSEDCMQKIRAKLDAISTFSFNYVNNQQVKAFSDALDNLKKEKESIRKKVEKTPFYNALPKNQKNLSTRKLLNAIENSPLFMSARDNDPDKIAILMAGSTLANLPKKSALQNILNYGSDDDIDENTLNNLSVTNKNQYRAMAALHDAIENINKQLPALTNLPLAHPAQALTPQNQELVESFREEISQLEQCTTIKGKTVFQDEIVLKIIKVIGKISFKLLVTIDLPGFRNDSNTEARDYLSSDHTYLASEIDVNLDIPKINVPGLVVGRAINGIANSITGSINRAAKVTIRVYISLEGGLLQRLDSIVQITNKTPNGTLQRLSPTNSGQ